jgi:hypothetical protein
MQITSAKNLQRKLPNTQEVISAGCVSEINWHLHCKVNTVHSNNCIDFTSRTIASAHSRVESVQGCNVAIAKMSEISMMKKYFDARPNQATCNTITHIRCCHGLHKYRCTISFHSNVKRRPPPFCRSRVLFTLTSNAAYVTHCTAKKRCDRKSV